MSKREVMTAEERITRGYQKANFQHVTINSRADRVDLRRAMEKKEEIPININRKPTKPRQVGQV